MIVVEDGEVIKTKHREFLSGEMIHICEGVKDDEVEAQIEVQLIFMKNVEKMTMEHIVALA